MSTTAKDVFDIAMGLMDEVDANSGSTDTADTKEYKQRSALILTALCGQLYPYSDTYEAPESGLRPVCAPVSSLDDEIDLDGYLARSVLPYGLASQLLLDENPQAASFFQQKFEEGARSRSQGVPQSFQDIENVYGGSYNRFGSW